MWIGFIAAVVIVFKFYYLIKRKILTINSIRNLWKKIKEADWFVTKKINHKTIDANEYFNRFSGYITDCAAKNKEALDRAWKCRDFEIDKLLQRSIFFWGFIAVIFTGYSLITNSNSETYPSNLPLNIPRQ